MSILSVLATCPCSRPCCMSLLHVHAVCPCFMSKECRPCCMFLLPVHAAYPCYMFMLHIHATFSFCMLHFHAACCMTMLRVLAPCPCSMSKQNEALQTTCRASLIRIANSSFFRQYWPEIDNGEKNDDGSTKFQNRSQCRNNRAIRIDWYDIRPTLVFVGQHL